MSTVHWTLQAVLLSTNVNTCFMPMMQTGLDSLYCRPKLRQCFMVTDAEPSKVKLIRLCSAEATVYYKVECI